MKELYIFFIKINFDFTSTDTYASFILQISFGLSVHYSSKNGIQGKSGPIYCLRFGIGLFYIRIIQKVISVIFHLHQLHIGSQFQCKVVVLTLKVLCGFWPVFLKKCLFLCDLLYHSSHFYRPVNFTSFPGKLMENTEHKIEKHVEGPVLLNEKYHGFCKDNISLWKCQ